MGYIPIRDTLTWQIVSRTDLQQQYKYTYFFLASCITLQDTRTYLQEHVFHVTYVDMLFKAAMVNQLLYLMNL